jgi:hypothetical protein
MLDKMPSIFTRSDTGKIDLGWADESLATLWETSQAALQEMSDQLPLVRRAVRPFQNSASVLHDDQPRLDTFP